MQLKILKNKILIVSTAILITIFSANLSYAETQKNTVQTQQKPAATALIPSKKENKNILGKFFITMLWVLSSCVIIYGVLLLYKKSKSSADTDCVKEKDIAMNLESPSSVDDATDFVIKKF